MGYTGEGTPPAIPDDVRVEAARRYIEAYETVTGCVFAADTEEPLRESAGISGWPEDAARGGSVEPRLASRRVRTRPPKEILERPTQLDDLAMERRVRGR